MRRFALGCLVVLVTFEGLFLVATPSEAAITFGSNLNAPATQVTSVGPTRATTSNVALPASSTAPGGLTSPIDGVVVRWRMKVGSDGLGQATPRLIRPGNSTTATGAGTGTAVTPQLNAINVFLTRLPVKAGDGIAFDLQSSGFMSDNPTPGATVALWQPALVDGEAPRPAPGYEIFSNYEHLINADVERDADNDGFGDETQDQCPGQAGPNNGCPPGTAPPPCRGIPATIVGTNGNDVLSGTPGQDVMVGQGGNDTLSGLAGNDLICGGKGNDTLKGGAGNDQLSGQKGNDNLYGQKGNDKLSGKSGNDTLIGGPGKDTLTGGAGKDKQVQ